MLDLVRKIPSPYKSSLEGYFKEEHEQFRQKLRQFFEENVTQKCEQWEKEKISPIKEMIKLLGESNFLGARFPTNLGGKGLDVWYHVVVAEELARIPSGGIGMGVTIHNDMVAPMISDYGSTPECKQILLSAIKGDVLLAHSISEKEAGADVSNISTQVIDKDESHYLVTGEKRYTSLATQADFFAVLGKLDADRVFPFNMVMLLVPRKFPGVEVSPRQITMGNATCDVANINLKNVVLPKAYRIGEEGFGFSLQMTQFQQERILSACRATAMADFYLKCTELYCNDRKAFGSNLIEFQNIKYTFGKLKTEIELSRQLNYTAIKAWETNDDYAELSAMSKLESCKLVRLVADECVQLFGARGYLDDHFISRFYRDSRLLPISTGSEEMMLKSIAMIKGFKDA